MAISPTPTTISDLPDVILSIIIAAVSDVRSRNSASLVCHKWLLLERSTRTSLTLRGNFRDIFFLPNCFRSVTELDLSLLSPWGYPLLSPNTPPATATLIAHLLRQSFPAVKSLSIYARNPSTLLLLASQWPFLEEIKLVRWHQRPQLEAGEELQSLFQVNQSLTKIDLSSFYCWTDDVPAALSAYPMLSSTLSSLNLLNPSFSEGLKSDQLKEVTKSCPNLKEFRAACIIDPRYIGFVGDEAVVSVAANCPKLSVLHLADTSVLVNLRADPSFEGYTADDSRITPSGLTEVFSGLPLLEELVLDLCNNIRCTSPVLEILNAKCPKLRTLKLGQFHGITMPIESKLDGGVALCQGLQSLSLRTVGDLTDMGLIAIGRGCCKLSKFEVQSCKKITMMGLRTLTSLLKRTLVDVKISCCKNLNAAMSLKALEPIQDRIRSLHIDCIWDYVEELQQDMEVMEEKPCNFDLNISEPIPDWDQPESDSMCGRNKRRRYTYDLNCPYMDYYNSSGNGLLCRRWESLEKLSLWIGVGEHLTPLADVGLEECPKLEEIRIKVEGDCRELPKPSRVQFGLSCLVQYPKLSKMHLDCGETIGYANTAPPGHMDLSLWERFYLLGIERLRSLTELDYWPPQDRDVNQRSISLPAAGLLQQCLNLRKLFIHGTAHEHFLNFLLKIPNLRDVQLREDYYPAPENDMSTEMRADSLSRFEASLNRRPISD